MLPVSRLRTLSRGTIRTPVVAGVLSSGAAAGEIPGAVVRTTVSDSERDYELRSATLSANGATTELIVAARSKGTRPKPGSLVWVTVDASGRVLSQQNPLGTLSLSSPTAINLRAPDAGSGFVFLRDRGFLLLRTVDGGSRLVRSARSNEPAVIQPVTIRGRSPIINRVLATKDEHLGLVGSIGLPLVAQIDAEGKTITAHVLREEMGAVNAVFDSEGSAVVVGQQGAFEKASVWVGRVSPRGEVLAKTAFPGSPTDITRGSDGTYVVLIQRISADGTEILMRALAPDLSERWTRSLVSRQPPANFFRVAPVRSGGFIVAGAKNRGLWISRVKPDGAEVWTEAQEPIMSLPELERVNKLELVYTVELAWTQDVFVTAYTAFVVEGRDRLAVVRAIRFTAK